MTVQELIEKLNTVQDKDQECMISLLPPGRTHEVFSNVNGVYQTCSTSIVDKTYIVISEVTVNKQLEHLGFTTQA